MENLAALAWGLPAALCWGTGVATSRVALRHERRIWIIMLWLFVAELCTAGVGVAVLAVARGVETSAAGAVGSLGMGMLYLLGEFLFFAALNRARISLVAPIVACNGAVTAVIAVLAGAELTAVAASGLAVMVVGVVAVTSARSDTDAPDAPDDGREQLLPILLAIASALSFGVAYFVAGRITDTDPALVVALSRVGIVTVVFVMCAGVGRQSVAVASRAWPWAAVTGCLNAVGYIAFIEGSRQSLPVAAVATSQWSAIAVILGIVLLHEPVTARHALGVGLVVVGLSAVALPT